mgnify:CR=1 FL=1
MGSTLPRSVISPGHGHASAAPAGSVKTEIMARGHGDARRGPVLRDRALRDVHVQVVVCEELLPDAVLRVRVRAIGQRGLGRLLHHVAELSR